MSSCHDPAIKMFRCLFIIFENLTAFNASREKANNLFWADGNRIEQCFAVHIFQCCQQYCSALLSLFVIDGCSSSKYQIWSCLSCFPGGAVKLILNLLFLNQFITSGNDREAHYIPFYFFRMFVCNLTVRLVCMLSPNIQQPTETRKKPRL